MDAAAEPTRPQHPALSDMPLDSLIHIQGFLDPVDIIALRKTSRLDFAAASGLARLPSPRVHAFLPTFPMEKIIHKELEHAALSPLHGDAQGAEVPPFSTRDLQPEYEFYTPLGFNSAQMIVPVPLASNSSRTSGQLWIVLGYCSSWETTTSGGFSVYQCYAWSTNLGFRPMAHLRHLSNGALATSDNVLTFLSHEKVLTNWNIRNDTMMNWKHSDNVTDVLVSSMTSMSLFEDRLPLQEKVDTRPFPQMMYGYPQGYPQAGVATPSCLWIQKRNMPMLFSILDA
ncbi:hypothetical protein LshimejAT787_0706260 [Lyophyllum shimeji]|uniref:F-box domain-containing protein n=1 Tax=Lyophyllum shimeji TaxID=47721 RepID=A0A9P3PQX2_LYOSH|nr:hypothetical protein LshimejAT787_0706260 [Lyophyllum shimeji]